MVKDLKLLTKKRNKIRIFHSVGQCLEVLARATGKRFQIEKEEQQLPLLRDIMILYKGNPEEKLVDLINKFIKVARYKNHAKFVSISIH